VTKRMNLFDLSGKVALITGSSRGIGRSIAETFAEAGAKVVVSSRKYDDCQAVAGNINDAGGAAVAIACNVSKEEQVENLVIETGQNFGPVDVLVCNAATNPVYGSMIGLKNAAFDKVMATNVQSSVWLVNRIAPQMEKAGGGVIILLGSIVGSIGSRNIGAYALSKAANSQLARNYAVELGPSNIRVNAIAPGLIRTDFATVLWDGKAGENFAARTPLGRLGEPKDIAGVAQFLASDAASFVTGQTIIADGGVLTADPF